MAFVSVFAFALDIKTRVCFIFRNSWSLQLIFLFYFLVYFCIEDIHIRSFHLSTRFRLVHHHYEP